MMTIAVDARTLNRPRLRGIGRYLHEVLQRLTLNYGVKVIAYGDRPDFPFHIAPAISDRVSVKLMDPRGYRFASWEQVALPYKVWRDRAEMVFFPGNTGSVVCGKPTVVTLHDTFPWDYPVPGASWFYWHVLQPLVYHNAAKIITVSGFSKGEIVKRWPRLAKKTVIISHGLGQNFCCLDGEIDKSQIPVDEERPYVLYVGGDDPRKRFEWALEVFIHARKVIPELRMVALGMGSAHGVDSLVKKRGAVGSSIIVLPPVPDDVVPRLYRRAICVLYPTLCEGFGFPVLESNAMGTPIMLSPVGSLAELTGPANVFLPEYDLDAWITAVSHAYRRRWPERNPNTMAVAWARGFSWDRASERHFEVIKEAVSSWRKLRRVNGISVF